LASRWWLHEVVTEPCWAPLSRRQPRLVNNPGARVSCGVWTIVAQAASDPELPIATASGRIAGRSAYPARADATEAVRTRLLHAPPPYLFEEIPAAILAASVGVDREMSKPRDFAGAKRFVARLKSEGRLKRSDAARSCRATKIRGLRWSPGELSNASIEIVSSVDAEPAQRRHPRALQVAGLSWETVNRVLDCRFSTGVTAPDEIANLKDRSRN